MLETSAITVPHYIRREILPLSVKKPLECLNCGYEESLSVRFWDWRARKRTLIITETPNTRPTRVVPAIVISLFEWQSQVGSAS